MPEITAITPQQKDKTRCNIYVDGRFYCGMKLQTVMASGLKAGMQIDLVELSKMQLESEKQTALEKALNHISLSMKTEREVRDYLKKKGYLQDVSDYVVERMRYYGYLDDGQYAASYAAHAGAKKGGRLIALELRRKGIAAEAIEEAVSSLGDETKSAKAVLEKYLRGKDVTDKKTVQRAYAHLLSKGFDYDTARAALEGLLDED